MRTIHAMCLVLTTMLLVGCWPLSIEPLYVEGEGEMPEGLVGVWRDEGDNPTRYEFVVDPQRRGYRVSVTDPDKQVTTFKATVVRLGDAMFLDALAIWGQDNVPAWYGMNSMPLHAVFRLELAADGELFLTPIMEEPLTRMLADKPDLIAHRAVRVVNTDGEIATRLMITATTQELRAFFEKHARDMDLFTQPIKLVRGDEVAGR
jgi:hypothetical protein